MFGLIYFSLFKFFNGGKGEEWVIRSKLVRSRFCGLVVAVFVRVQNRDANMKSTPLPRLDLERYSYIELMVVDDFSVRLVGLVQ